MGDISRKRKYYAQVDHERVLDLPPALSFEFDGRTWNFEELSNWGKRENLAYHFSVVFWQRRHDVALETKKNHWNSYKTFWQFLDAVYPKLTNVKELTSEVIQSFIVWLSYTKIQLGRWDKQAGELTSQGTQHKMYSVIKGVIWRLIANDIICQDIELPVIAFRNMEYNSKQAAPYSRAERQRIVDACKKEIIKIKENKLHKERVGMHVPYMLLIALRTGMNAQPLLDLQIDSLKPSILDGRMMLSTYKNRGYSSQNIEVSETEAYHAPITKRVASLFEEAAGHTITLRLHAPEELKQALWLIRDRYDEDKTTYAKPNAIYLAIQKFVKNYDLRNDQGKPLNLNFRRLRPTFAHALLRINGGDLRDLQRRLNHKNIATTMRYLDPEQDEFKSSFKHQGLVMQSWVKGDNGDVNVNEMAQKLNITIDEAKKIISGANDMLVGSCKNPFDSPFKKNSDSACTNFMACFRCPNQIITQDDLHKVFSFYWYLLSKKAMIPVNAWDKAYAWIIRIIDEDIVPQIDPELDIDAIKKNAHSNPHPAWANTETTINELGANLS